ncbi:hypothetical protein J6590_004314 [Homalodisca vitripennis]|nr:hypothetical protein J6590_004314 [Homalodisca vitripennis]
MKEGRVADRRLVRVKRCVVIRTEADGRDAEVLVADGEGTPIKIGVTRVFRKGGKSGATNSPTMRPHSITRHSIRSHHFMIQTILGVFSTFFAAFSHTRCAGNDFPASSQAVRAIGRPHPSIRVDRRQLQLPQFFDPWRSVVGRFVFHEALPANV